ncbi:MAG: sulfatase-like hydrolase/transferase [Rhodobacterales bacterium]|nr:sulfatase-like hydrolase/transferase [Rhodobacterales bacterium]
MYQYTFPSIAIFLGVSVALTGCSFFDAADESVRTVPSIEVPVGPTHPNVLVIMWDTTRADRMSLYGHDRSTTPRLDAFAADAAVFEQAISPGMWTVPAHGSWFTGLPVASHGANAKWIWLDNRFVTLAEHFRANGYDTYAYTSNPYLSENSNILQGFDTIDYAWKAPWAEKAAAATQAKLIEGDKSAELSPSWRPEGHGEGWPKHLTAYKDGGDVTREAFSEWLDERAPKKQWVAYLNFLEAHHPRVPSEEARKRLHDDEMVESGLSTDASLFRTMSYMEGKVTYEPAELDAIKGVYDATISDLDTVTGHILDDLKERGVLEDTIVVIVSDHGEHLGEHGLFDHRWSVYQELLHVPLVIRYPKKMVARREASPVSTQALFPTLCELADVACPPGLIRSLTSMAIEPVYAELIQPTPRLPPIRAAYQDLDNGKWRWRYQVMFDRNYKLIRRSDGNLALYDLRADPTESRDLASSEAARTKGMLQATRDWQEGIRPYNPVERSNSDKPKNALKADDETRKQLEMLGYTRGEDSP